MKKITLLISLLSIMVITNAQTLNVDVSDFESAQAVSAASGAVASIIANPSKDAHNLTDNVLQISRTSSNWWELVDLPTDFNIPASGNCYVHVLVKSSVALDIAFRAYPDNATTMRASMPYNGNDEW